MENRFILEESKLKANHSVCTDTQNKIICTFENHKFNETQKFVTLDDFNPNEFMKLAKFCREMGDWLSKNHYNIIF